MNSKTKICLSLILITTILLNCNDQEDIIPYVYVNIYIDLNDPEYVDLNAVGNSVMVTGGVKGIIIFRKSLDEFTAFDRASPANPDCAVNLDETGTTAIDTCTNSKFSLLLDGAVIEGPASLPLKMYQVHYNPNTLMLQITN
jgi:hypothetical protein